MDFLITFYIVGGLLTSAIMGWAAPYECGKRPFTALLLILLWPFWFPLTAAKGLYKRFSRG